MSDVVAAGQLRAYLVRLFCDTGMTRSGARTLSTALVAADLRGIPGHGSRLAPTLAAKLRDGRLTPRPHLATVTAGAGYLVLDGDLAPGPVAARRAAAAAALRARRAGVGLVVVRNAGHAGALGVPAEWLARRGLVGMVAAQTSAASVAVLGGPGTALLGNPAFAVALPARAAQPPVLLDMAAASMSWGRVHQHARANRPLPPGHALDAAGRPTCDPGSAAVLLPTGVRAQALATVLELLVGALTGSPVLPDGREGRGLLCLAIDPARLGTKDHLAAGVAEMARALARHGARLPGAHSWTHHERAAAEGIAMDREDLDRLIAAGQPRVCPPHAWIRPAARTGTTDPNPMEAPL